MTVAQLNSVCCALPLSSRCFFFHLFLNSIILYVKYVVPGPLKSHWFFTRKTKIYFFMFSILFYVRMYLLLWSPLATNMLTLAMIVVKQWDTIYYCGNRIATNRSDSDNQRGEKIDFFAFICSFIMFVCLKTAHTWACVKRLNLPFCWFDCEKLKNRIHKAYTKQTPVYDNFHEFFTWRIGQTFAFFYRRHQLI